MFPSLSRIGLQLLPNFLLEELQAFVGSERVCVMRRGDTHNDSCNQTSKQSVGRYGYGPGGGEADDAGKPKYLPLYLSHTRSVGRTDGRRQVKIEREKEPSLSNEGCRRKGQ